MAPRLDILFILHKQFSSFCSYKRQTELAKYLELHRWYQDS